MQKLIADIRQKPLELVIGLCVLTVAASGASVANAASTSLSIMFLTSLFYVRDWRSTWAMLSTEEKWLCYSFVLFTLSGALSYINASDVDEFIKQMGRYIRFTLIISVYLMLRGKQLDITRYLYIGIVVSGFVFLGFALHSMHVRPDMPATGHYHHITFGDAAMLNAGIMGIMLLSTKRKTMFTVVIALSALCALYASFLSQSRGAWIVLPVYLSAYITYTSSTRKAGAIKLIAFAAIAVVVFMLMPAGDVIEKRYDEAVTEIEQFTRGEKFDTSIGGRLSMWNIAHDVWEEHPFVGTGLGDFDEDMMRYQAMGMYPNIDVHGSTHNIFVQALAGTGIIGFVILCYSLVVAPLTHFIRAANKPDAMAGVILIISYAVFGLSESWILRAPAISIYLAYVIALSASCRKLPDGTKGGEDKTI